MKLEWVGSGTGAGYYVDVYRMENGRSFIIGAERENEKPSRDDVIRAFESLHVHQQITQKEG